MGHTGTQALVGGASDGNIGVVAMRYETPSTKQLNWRKTWFFLVSHIEISIQSCADHDPPIYSPMMYNMSWLPVSRRPRMLQSSRSLINASSAVTSLLTVTRSRMATSRAPQPFSTAALGTSSTRQIVPCLCQCSRASGLAHGLPFLLRHNQTRLSTSFPRGSPTMT